jgi:hypothetical protein
MERKAMQKKLEGMKLHQGMGPNSYRVRIFLAEKGLEVPMAYVDFGKREHKAPEFLKLNSLGQIPGEIADHFPVRSRNLRSSPPAVPSTCRPCSHEDSC